MKLNHGITGLHRHPPLAIPVRRRGIEAKRLESHLPPHPFRGFLFLHEGNS